MRALLLVFLASTAFATPAFVLHDVGLLSKPPPEPAQTLAVLARGMAVEVAWCNTDVCEVTVDGLRGYAPSDWLGDARAQRVSRAQAHAAALRTLGGGRRVEAELATQRVERLPLQPLRPTTPPPRRLGLVGVALVKRDDARLLRDGEAVLALCSDGVRELPVKVRATQPAPGVTAVSVAVACDAELVVSLADAGAAAVDPLRLPRTNNAATCVSLPDVDGDGARDSLCRQHGHLQLISTRTSRALADLELADTAPRW